MPDIFNSANRSSKPQSSAPLQTAASHLNPDVEPQPTNTFHSYSPLIDSYGPTASYLSSFAPKPLNTIFNFQLDGEEILLLVRQHPLTQMKLFFAIIILVVLPLGIFFFPFPDFLPAKFHLLALLGWFLLVVAFGLEAFLDWFYNVNFCTNERIVDIDFRSLLFRDVSTARLDRIEDVTTSTAGYLGSFFTFGNVKVQTAGATDVFEFHRVPSPNKVSEFINELINDAEQRHRTGIERRGG